MQSSSRGFTMLPPIHANRTIRLRELLLTQGYNHPVPGQEQDHVPDGKVLLFDPTIKPERYFFGLLKRPIRRRHLATIKVPLKSRWHDEDQPWQICVYGDEFSRRMQGLAAVIGREFNASVHVILESREPRFEVLSEDYRNHGVT